MVANDRNSPELDGIFAQSPDRKSDATSVSRVPLPDLVRKLLAGFNAKAEHVLQSIENGVTASPLTIEDEVERAGASIVRKIPGFDSDGSSLLMAGMILQKYAEACLSGLDLPEFDRAIEHAGRVAVDDLTFRRRHDSGHLTAQDATRDWGNIIYDTPTLDKLVGRTKGEAAGIDAVKQALHAPRQRLFSQLVKQMRSVDVDASNAYDTKPEKVAEQSPAELEAARGNELLCAFVALPLFQLAVGRYLALPNEKLQDQKYLEDEEKLAKRNLELDKGAHLLRLLKLGDPIPRASTSPSSLSFETRLALLDQFVDEHRGQPISDYVRNLFPELFSESGQSAGLEAQAPPLPKQAPERWPSDHAKKTETPPEFCVRVYGTWMAAGVLTRQDLKDLDPKLFASLDDWQKNNNRKAKPDALPEGFKLLTKDEANDAWVERVRARRAPLPEDPEELAKFANALQYRASRALNTKS